MSDRLLRPNTGHAEDWTLPAYLAAGAVLSVMVSLLLVEFGPGFAIAPFVAAAVIAVGLHAYRDVQRATLILALVLSIWPVMRINIAGTMPIYAVDAIVAAGVSGLLLRGRIAHRFAALTAIYLATWMPAWAVQIFTLDVFLEPTYGLLRNALAVCGGLLAYELVSRRDGFTHLVTAIVFGSILTSLLAIAQALPMTSGPVKTALQVAVPAFTESAYRVYPERSFALMTAPTTLSGFLVLVIVIIIVQIGAVHGWRRTLYASALVLGALALVSTYSRQWALALPVGLLVVVVLRPALIGRVVLMLVPASVAVALTLSNGALDAEYLTERFTSDRNIAVRQERQARFFDLAREEPVTYLVAGHGFAGQDLVGRALVGSSEGRSLREGASENSFLLEVFNHGLPAGLLYLAIVLLALSRAVIVARERSDTVAVAIAAALATAITLHFFDNYFSENIFMKLLLWILIGAAFGLRRAPAEGLRARAA